MKGNKKILIAIVLLLIVAVSFTTYAIYRSSVTAEGSLKAAAWYVTLNGTDIEEVNNLTFDKDDIQWTTHTGYNDTIAPGDEGVIEYVVDASGSEVDVLVTAELEDGATLPDGMSVEITSGTNGVQEISYGDNMQATVEITVKWDGDTDDTTAKDINDKSFEGQDLSIPVKLTVRQKLATD